MELELITIQKVQSLNKPLHEYLKSKKLNKQNMPFYIEKGNPDPHAIIMLSPLGRLFHFECKDGKYRSVPFQDAYLLQEALLELGFAIGTYKYPFYAETYSQINQNLNYKPIQQPLF